MASADNYLNQIKEMGLECLEINVSSVNEAKEAIKNIRSMKRELQQIKRNVNLDMKTIRAEYSQRMSTAASTSSGIASLFMGRKIAGQMRADEKRRLRMERDGKLKPYDSIKITIDDILIQLDSAKIQLESFIEKTKAEEQAKKQDGIEKLINKNPDLTTSYCHQCGSTVTDEDKFCRNCGARLS